MEKLTHSKKSLSCLGLIEFLRENKSSSNADIEDFLTFIQTVPHGGNIYKSYVKARISIYENQKTKSSITLPTDSEFELRLLFEFIIGVTITLTTFKKKYHQFYFKIWVVL